MTNYPLRGITSIKDQFLNTNMYFGLEFAEGFIFGRVLRRDVFNYKPLAMVDETGTALTLAAGGVSSDIEIRDPRQSGNTVVGGDDMPALWGGKPHIYHGNIGINPPNMQAYVRYPEKTGALANPPMNALPVPVASSGDHLSKMDGDDSPFEDPTNWIEMVIVPNETPSVTIYNDNPSTDTGADTERPTINVLFAHYVFDILKPVRNARSVANSMTPADRQRARVDNRLIRKIVMGDLDPILKWLPVGFGQTLINYNQLLSQWWQAIPISMADAKALEEI